MAYVYQVRPGGNFYMVSASYSNGKRSRTHINLKTRDPAEAERRRVEQTEIERQQPRAHLRWDREALEKEFGTLRGKTRVSKENYALALRAMQVLGDGERFKYLLAPISRTTILGTLGRIKCDSILRLMADEICENGMPTKAALRFIRQFLGTAKARRTPRLAEVLRQRIAWYCERFHVEDFEIAAVLRSVADEMQTGVSAE